MTSILVIDDDADVRAMICELLTSLGYEVRMAENGNQGLKSYQSAPANVVLLDMFMPEKDGIETLRDLKRYDPKARVIALTGGGKFGQVGILQPALAMGACKLLYKPISLTELRSAVEETLAM